MKHALFVICLLLGSINAIAQTTPPKRLSYRLTDKSIVKDSTGKILPQPVWKQLMKSGDYMFRPVTPGDTINLLLYKLTAKQKADRSAAIKAGKPFTIQYYGKPIVNQIDEHKRIVKDSAGHVLPYDIWMPMIKEGEYTLFRHAIGTDTTAYYLRRATAEQKKRRADLIANMRPPESSAFVTGQPLPPFSVIDINGKKISAEEWKGKTVVLCFWFTTLVNAPILLPELNKIVEKYKDNSNVMFIAITLDTHEAVRDFNVLLPFKYQLISNGRSIATSLKVSRYPTHVVVNKQGIVQFHATGYGSTYVNWIDKSITESEAK